MFFRHCVALALSVGACQGAGTPPPSPPSTQPAAPPAPAPSPPARDEAIGQGALPVSGVVVDDAGRPVGGAHVALVPAGLLDPSGARLMQAESAEDGSFRLAGHPGRRYGVTATAPGQVAAFSAEVEAGRSGLRLTLGGAGRHLSGRVGDREGRPRAGAEVRLSRGFGQGGDIFLVESDKDGSFRAAVPDGDYYASAAQAGYAAAQRAAPKGLNSVDLTLEPVWPPGPPPPPVVDWVRSHETPVAAVEAGRGFADLEPLRAVVGDARVVGLGEATHGTREIFQLKHRVLEFLVSEMGFTLFAIEISLPEALAVNDYVLGGPGDPERLLEGQFVAVWQAEELCDAIRWAREWNRTHPRKVRFYGLDMRQGVRAAKDALAYLARADRAALSSPAALALAPLADPFTYQDVIRGPKPELSALAERARELAARLAARRAELVARSGAESFWRASAEARMLVQLLEARAESDNAASVRSREAAMAENLMSALDREGPGARAVVWAHNTHVAGEAGAEPRMMGVHLRERLGAGYRAVGSVLYQGAYQSIDPSTGLLRNFAVAPADPGSLEGVLAAAGRPLALLDLQTLPTNGVVSEWFRAFQAVRQFDGLYDDDRPEGWAGTSAIVSRKYDALLFVAAGAAARPLPFARAAYAEAPPRAPSASNLDFEEAEGPKPRAWLWSPERERVCGYALALDERRPFEGRAGAQIARAPGPRYGECAAQLRQRIDATPYRGGRVRLQAAVRVERAGEHAHLYLQAGPKRVARSASGGDFRTYDVTLDVPGDATSLELGLAFDGEGRAWLDAVSVLALPAPP